MSEAENASRPARGNPVLLLTVAGYVLVVLLVVLDEALDLPHRLLGAAPSPFEWQAVFLHSLAVAVVTVVIGAVMYRLVRGRRAALQEARRLATHYRVLADHTHDWEFWAGENGELLYTSPSCERITGYPPEAFAADPDLLLGIIHPEDRAAFVEHRATSHREHVAGRIRFRVVRADGGLRWISHVCQPVFGERGRFLGVRGSNRDVTEVVAAEQAVGEIAAHLRRAQEVAKLGSWELDLVSGELYWSDQVYRMFGLPPGASLDYGAFLESVHEEDRDFVDRSWQAALSGAVYDIEHRIRVGGGVRWVRETAEVTFDDSGKALRGIGTVQDITARKLAEEAADRLGTELAHVTRVATLGEFSAALAHELNQPLTAILANAQAALRFLDREEPDLAEIREILEDVVADDQRARDVILRLRELTRKPLGKRAPERLSVNALVEGVLAIVRADVSQRGVELRTGLAAGLPEVVADGVQVQQALLNLVLNALEAMTGRELRRLTVATAADGDGHVEITVADTGPGLGGADPESLFRPFFTTKPEGMGMGLAISRAAVEAQGGQLRAEGGPEGGARFVISLPASEDR